MRDVTKVVGRNSNPMASDVSNLLGNLDPDWYN